MGVRDCLPHTSSSMSMAACVECVGSIGSTDWTSDLVKSTGIAGWPTLA